MLVSDKSRRLFPRCMVCLSMIFSRPLADYLYYTHIDPCYGESTMKCGMESICRTESDKSQLGFTKSIISDMNCRVLGVFIDEVYRFC